MAGRFQKTKNGVNCCKPISCTVSVFWGGVKALAMGAVGGGSCLLRQAQLPLEDVSCVGQLSYCGRIKTNPEKHPLHMCVQMPRP
jgi:hypothetical protein